MIIIIYFFLYQNVRITEVLTAVTERLRTLITTVIVTVQSDLDGSVSKGPQARECQPHVQLPILMVFTVRSSDCKVKKARFYEFLFTLG